MEGKIKWFNHLKGYGFIETEEGNDVFIHINSVPEGTDLKENDHVEFEVERTNRGLQAQRVKKIT